MELLKRNEQEERGLNMLQHIIAKPQNNNESLEKMLENYYDMVFTGLGDMDDNDALIQKSYLGL